MSNAGTQVAAFLTKVPASGQGTDKSPAEDTVLTDVIVDPQQLECQASDLTLQVCALLCTSVVTACCCAGVGVLGFIQVALTGHIVCSQCMPSLILMRDGDPALAGESE